MTLLETEALTVKYGPLQALTEISVNVGQGQVVTIIGANGAGKSTFLKSIAGVVRPASGRILFDGQDITTLKPHERLDLGIVLCPEGRKLFPELTVQENLRMGAYRLRDKAEFQRRYDHICSVFPRVAERRNQLAASMSGGEQQMVAIARALMSGPRLLMLDEPTLGLAPKMIHEVASLVSTINAEGVSVLIVEQNARLALRISEQAYVFETGRMTLSGPSETLMHSNEIQQAYLGGSHAA